MTFSPKEWLNNSLVTPWDAAAAIDLEQRVYQGAVDDALAAGDLRYVRQAPAARAHRANPIDTGGNGTWQTIPMDTWDYDPSECFQQPGQVGFYTSLVSGAYQVSTNVGLNYASNIFGQFFGLAYPGLAFAVNGVQVARGGFIQITEPTPPAQWFVNMTDIVTIPAGEALSLQIQLSGAQNIPLLVPYVNLSVVSLA